MHDDTPKRTASLKSMLKDFLESNKTIPEMDHAAVLLAADFPELGELEKRYIQLVLKKTRGRKEKAAQMLGINRRTLYRKEREYGWVKQDPELE